MTEQKWFERDPLPRAVLDGSGCIWVRGLEGEYDRVESEERWSPYKEAKNLEMCFGPCVPLVAETGQAEPLSSDTLTVPAGELKRALELRMGEHAGRIRGVLLPETGGSYSPEAAVKAGKIAQLMLAIDPNKNKRWALTPVRDGETDE